MEQSTNTDFSAHNDKNPQVTLSLPATNEASPNANNSNDGAGADSPESASLYSDEIPSGYNSGEQYDTVSMGYMSGEAYELPDTRMDLHEPRLDIIEECLHPLGSGNDDSDTGKIFMLPSTASMDKDYREKMGSFSSSSSSATSKEDVATIDTVNETNPASNVIISIGGTSIGGFGGGNNMVRSSAKSKHRKNMLAIPMETTQLGMMRLTTKRGSADDNENVDYDDDYGFDPESSDPGMTAATGGYRAVPSDTDTSAFDSDANAIKTNHNDSGTELLQHASLRSKTKAERIAARKAKRVRRHDEEWFLANDSKQWSIIRQVCFWMAIASMFIAFTVAGILIYQMPRHCDPPHHWYQGTVFMELALPMKDVNSFILDVNATIERLPAIKELGVTAIHIKDLTLDPDDPEKRLYLSSEAALSRYSEVLDSDGNANTRLKDLVTKCHALNMSVIVQVPVVDKNSGEAHGTKAYLNPDVSFAVLKTVEYWAKIDIDGIFFDGLENFAVDDLAAHALRHWQLLFKQVNKVLNESDSSKSMMIMTSFDFATELEQKGHDFAFSLIDLIDVKLDVRQTDFEDVSSQLARIAAWQVKFTSQPWINWNMQFVDSLPLSEALLSFQFFLPGTISIPDLNQTAALPGGSSSSAVSLARNLTAIRTVAVPIYMNGNLRRCECPEGVEKELNFALRQPDKVRKVLQLERFFSRRSRYLLIASFESDEVVHLEKVASMYSGGDLLLDTSQKMEAGGFVEIRDLELRPGHAYLIKLPK